MRGKEDGKGGLKVPEAHAETQQDSEIILQETKKMDRRDFFATAGKLIIPTLGILGLSLSGFTGKAEAANDCSGSCVRGCSNSCSGSCLKSCTDTCMGRCTSILSR